MVKVSLEPYFQLENLAFCEGEATGLINDFQFALQKACRRQGDELLVDIESAAKLLAPEFTVKKDGTETVFENGEKAVRLTVREEDEEGCIPLLKILTEHFGWSRKREIYRGKLLMKAAKNAEFRMDVISLFYQVQQTQGILKKAFYLEEANAVIAYRLYVPVRPADGAKRKLALIVHGLGGGNVFDRANNKLAHMGEKYGYLILAPLAYTNGMHGSTYPMARDFVDAESIDPENPAGLTEEEKKIYSWCELADMRALEEVKRDYDVDGANIFLGGNSMGGDGSFYLASRYPEMFRAVAPCAGGPDFRFYPMERLKDLPVRVLCGTEDAGYFLLQDMTRQLQEIGVSAEFVGVGGEPHGNAWLHELEGMFRFFEAHAASSR